MKKWKINKIKGERKEREKKSREYSITFVALTLPRFVRVAHNCTAATMPFGEDAHTAQGNDHASHQTWPACNSICAAQQQRELAPHRPPFFDCLRAFECKRNPYQIKIYRTANGWNRSRVHCANETKQQREKPVDAALLFCTVFTSQISLQYRTIFLKEQNENRKHMNLLTHSLLHFFASRSLRTRAQQQPHHTHTPSRVQSLIF